MHNLLMEYVPRGTLTDTIRSHGGRLDESLIQYYTKQIVLGLDYLHSNDLVHCDIKGKNILVGEEGLKIADFGCSRWANPAKAMAEEAVVGGTAMYMAPEVARGEEQGFPSDIWGLGCTIIEMTTGKSPWPNIDNPITVLYQLAYSDELPEFPSFLSERAKDFLGKCLRRNPKERWTTCQLLNHPFLEEFNTCIKQIKESDSTSPVSILDQGIWNLLEETETFNDVIITTSENSPAVRIKRLSLFSGEPMWNWDDEDWITIREDDHEDNWVRSEEVEIGMNSGSNMASFSCRIEQLERLFGYSEESLKFIDINTSVKAS